MPALVVFGRKWKLGSDDFIFTAFVDTAIKASWLVGSVVVYLVNEPRFQTCQNEVYFNAYFCALILSIVVPFIIDVAVVVQSGKGAIMEEHARKWVPTLIYVRLGWELIDIGFNVVGTLWTFGDQFDCLQHVSPYTYSFVRRYVICNWISVGIIILLFKIFYDPFGKVNSTKSWEVKQCTNKYDVPITRLSTVWERKCRLYNCFWGRSSSGDYDVEVIAEGFHEVGRILAHGFHDTEFMTTDIVAGLIALYAKEQRLRQRLQAIEIAYGYKLKETETVITKPPAPLSRGDSSCAKLKLDQKSPESEVHLLRHYINYACGVSGWKNLLIDKWRHNPIRLLWKNAACSGSSRRPYHSNVVNDNCCFCNSSGMQYYLPGIEEDLVHVSFKCDYYEIPFLIALDHSTQAIVVALRGSYDLKDTLADLSGIPTPFTIEDGETVRTFLAHHGMLLVAQNVKKKLDRMKILGKLRDANPNYKLVLVGNCLGGASASILGMLLHSQYSDLRVFNFNSPGGVMSLEAARWCEPFTTTVTFGQSCLARMSISSFLDLKQRVQEAIRDCSTPKYKIFASGLGICCCMEIGSRLTFYSEGDNDIDKKQNNKNIAINMRAAFGDANTSEQKPPEIGAIKSSSFPHLMYLPGRIIHITETSGLEASSPSNDNSNVKLEGSGSRYQMRWADRNEFLKIIVSSKMGSDHTHCKIIKAFDEYLSQSTHL